MKISFLCVLLLLFTHQVTLALGEYTAHSFVELFPPPSWDTKEVKTEDNATEKCLKYALENTPLALSFLPSHVNEYIVFPALFHECLSKYGFRINTNNSLSPIIFTPNFFAFSNFDPGSEPATT